MVFFLAICKTWKIYEERSISLSSAIKILYKHVGNPPEASNQHTAKPLLHILQEDQNSPWLHVSVIPSWSKFEIQWCATWHNRVEEEEGLLTWSFHFAAEGKRSWCRRYVLLQLLCKNSSLPQNALTSSVVESTDLYHLHDHKPEQT